MSRANDERRRQHDADDREWAEIFRRSGDGQVECPSPDLIQAARASVLSPAVGGAVSTHVAGCVACRVLAESLDAIASEGPTPQESARMLQRIREATRSGAARAAGRRWLWLGGAAAALAFAAWWLTGSSGRAPVPSVFQVQAPEVLPMESPVEAAEAGDLAIALRPYREGRFDEAIHSLTGFVGRHPRNAYGHFYLGVAHLARSSDRQAVAALESAERLAVTRSVVAEQAGWHLAVAYHRLGEDDKAWPRFVTLCDARPALAKACAALREIAPTIDLQGVVTDADSRPLDGVQITEHVFGAGAVLLVTEPTTFATTTGAAGRYRLSGAPVSGDATVLVRASRHGYFTANARVTYAPQATANFVLHPWRFLAIGDVIESRTTQNAVCDPAEPCQRYAVSVDRSGTLDVSVTTSNRGALDVYVETPDGRVYGPRSRAPLHVELPASAGSTFQIRVLSFTASAEFELRTQLR